MKGLNNIWTKMILRHSASQYLVKKELKYYSFYVFLYYSKILFPLFLLVGLSSYLEQFKIFLHYILPKIMADNVYIFVIAEWVVLFLIVRTGYKVLNNAYTNFLIGRSNGGDKFTLVNDYFTYLQNHPYQFKKVLSYTKKQSDLFLKKSNLYILPTGATVYSFLFFDFLMNSYVAEKEFNNFFNIQNNNLEKITLKRNIYSTPINKKPLL